MNMTVSEDRTVAVLSAPGVACAMPLPDLLAERLYIARVGDVGLTAAAALRDRVRARLLAERLDGKAGR
jgi:hypothetical protein